MSQDDDPVAAAAQAIADYVADSYECLAQIELAKRRLATLKERVPLTLGPLVDDLTHDERVGLLADFYWEAIELPCEPIASALGLRLMVVLRDMGNCSTDVPCSRCGVDLIAESRAQYHAIQTEVRKAARSWKYHRSHSLFCADCNRADLEERHRALDEKREREQWAKYRRLTELQSMPYALYLRTPEWQEKRAQALKRGRYRCQLCGANQWVTLDVHHSTYERLGQELPADLIVLCRDCHTKHHAELPEAQS